MNIHCPRLNSLNQLYTAVFDGALSTKVEDSLPFRLRIGRPLHYVRLNRRFLFDTFHLLHVHVHRLHYPLRIRNEVGGWVLLSAVVPFSTVSNFPTPTLSTAGREGPRGGCTLEGTDEVVLVPQIYFDYFVSVCVYACGCVCVRVYMCACVCVRAWAWVHMGADARGRECVCECVCVGACVYVRVSLS
ncbi:hypothetical protein EVAR_13840_1 [Eumeta japonica]|uniref:Uncharacterized protein n=1 Tax=Eumeta variegata TaxID=151549 RepID=A0A4C1U1F7_EUMVA|nr:hypothetical protein EVAR_13840_1 [Eumeta japonica]